MGIQIWLDAVDPTHPSGAVGGNDMSEHVPFSTAPNGTQSLITVTQIVPGIGTAHLELIDFSPSTFLVAAITDTISTSITVAGFDGFPISGIFQIVIDDECLTVTAGNGTTTWTVTRGQAAASFAGSATTAATHTNGTPVFRLAGSVQVGWLSSIRIYDTANATNMFQGLVQKIKITVDATQRWLIIDAVDLNWLLGTALVGTPNGANWLLTPPATQFINVDPGATIGGNDQGTVQSLFSNYWLYGVAIDTTTYVNLVNPNLLGPSGQYAFTWDRVTLKTALDDTAGLTSATLIYWIDANACLHWTNTPVLGAPSGGGSFGGSGGTYSVGSLLGLFPTTTVSSGSTINDLSATPGDTIVNLLWSISGGGGGGGGGGSTYYLPPAPYNLSDNPDGINSLPYENFSFEADNSGFGFSVYVRGATDYTATTSLDYAGNPTLGTVNIGGTGWVGVGGVDGGPSYISQFFDAPGASDHLSRNAYGGIVLQGMYQLPVVHGTADVIYPGILFTAGSLIEITNKLGGLIQSLFYVTKSTTTFLSGTDVRRAALEWGTAPRTTVGQRAAAVASKAPVPISGAVQQGPTSSSYAPVAGGTVQIQTQLLNAAGQAWHILGKQVRWTIQVIDDSGTDVTTTTAYSFLPTTSTTNQNGIANTSLTTDPTANGVSYYVIPITLD